MAVTLSSCGDPNFSFSPSKNLSCGVDTTGVATITFAYPDQREFKVFGAYADVAYNNICEAHVYVYHGATLLRNEYVCNTNGCSRKQVSYDWSASPYTATKVVLDISPSNGREKWAYELRVTIARVAPSNTGDPSCPIAYSGEVSVGNNPVGIRNGEKREQVTDIAIATPAGQLEFTRSYRQSKQGQYQFMGLGWTHNLGASLTKITGTPNRIVAQLPNGGEGQFIETSSGSNQYTGLPGVGSSVAWDSGANTYTLTASDQSTLVFDSAGKLISQHWANNETWTYTYTSGLLTQISDGYSRSLQLSYISNTGQFNHNKLWRVGDHTASGLNTSTPTGRYVEFGYVPEKSNGVTISNPHALLSTVRDVRGNVWTYDYFGQHTGETDAQKLNFLSRYSSPSVDTTGDGTADGSLTRKRVTYTIASGKITNISEELGLQGSNPALLQMDYAFHAGTLGETTTETVAGKTKTYEFDGEVYVGQRDAQENSVQQNINDQFRPDSQTDANGNETQLAWSNDGTHLNSVTDALNHQTNFHYDAEGRLDYSIDAEARKTEYTYDDVDNPRAPTRVKVFAADGTTVLGWQEFVYDTKGRTLEEKTFDPSDGTTLLSKLTRTYGTFGNSAGLLESVTQIDLLDSGNNVSTTYTYDSAGRVVKTQKSSLFGSCQIAYTVYDAAGNIVASICNYQNAGAAPTTAAEAAALYDIADPDHNRVTTYEYDTLGRKVATTTNAGVGANATYAQTMLTVYDALDRVIRTISNYVADVTIPNPYTAAQSTFGHGVDNTQNLVTDTAYNARGLVRKQVNVLGNVTLYGYDDADRLVKTVQNASQSSYNNDYSGTGFDPALANYVPNGTADQDVVTSQAYDGNGNLVQTVDALGNITYTIYDALNRPVKTVRNAKDEATISLNIGDTGYNAADDPRAALYVPSTNPDHDVIETTEYDAMGRVIRTQQLLDHRPSASWDVTLYGYDTLGRNIKVVRAASVPSYDLTADPDLSEYVDSAEADRDIVEQTVYEVNGRVLYTEDVNHVQTWFAYDGLGRQIKTIVNPVGTATDDGVDDPRSSTYVPSEDADKDVIKTTVYDSDGRIQSTTDALGRVTRYVYDSLGRTIRTVSNYVDQGEIPDLWLYDDGWFQSDGMTAIDHDTQYTANIVTETIYDAQGRVEASFDWLHRQTHFVYDVLGRRTMTIANYVAQGSSDPSDWIWSSANSRWEDGDDNPIDHNDEILDENIITMAGYDLAGRVTASRDSMGIETRYEYDALGRRVKTTTNYVNGVFDEDVPDEDLIDTSTYNKAGQIVASVDPRETQTSFAYDAAGRQLTVTRAAGTSLETISYTCYDKAGRVLRMIANWSNDPSEPSPDARNADGNWTFTPNTHGAYEDRDLITTYRLDQLGRMTGVADPVGNENSTIYYKDGRVKWLLDPEDAITQYRYDALRRRTRVVQGYYDQQSRIVYGSDEMGPTGRSDIFISDVEGNNRVQLTDNDEHNQYPGWSPDGAKIAFNTTYANNGYSQISVVNADGSNLTPLTPGDYYVTEPDWSPDGTCLVVYLWNGTSYDLATIDAITGDTDDLVAETVYAPIPPYRTYDPKYSPDGTRISFSYRNQSNSNSTIALVSVAGADFFDVTHTSGHTSERAAWSPDGRHLVYQENGSENLSLYSIRPDGTERIRLTDGTFICSTPAWSPDGDQIVFHSLRENGSREIYVMLADGTRQRAITHLPGNDQQWARWSPFRADPALWTWNETLSRWENEDGDAIIHGANNDRNIVVDVAYDKAGRTLSMRDPRGNLTTYAYDDRDRRTTLTNPLDQSWETGFDLDDGSEVSSLTYPTSDITNRKLDRLSRTSIIGYGDPGTTPDVTMRYDLAGNRTLVAEYSDGEGTLARQTFFTYDDRRRLIQVDFDEDGDDAVDQTVKYEYDAGGRRTKLTLPGDLDVTYNYDERGNLVSLTDWDGQTTRYVYDNAQRLIAATRDNGLHSRYRYDAASRLRLLRHTAPKKTLGHFAYEVDRRGNRVQALEALPHPATTDDTVVSYEDDNVVYVGDWTTDGINGFKETTSFGASLKLIFFGTEASFTVGTGPDHSIYDVYIDSVLWQSFEGYAVSTGQRDIDLDLASEGPHTLEIRNRGEKNLQSSGYVLRFKHLVVPNLTYDLHTHVYGYDMLSRLVTADTYVGERTSGIPIRQYDYAYDVAGNRTQQVVTVGAIPTSTSYTYDAANRLVNDGTNTLTYDDNGNLTDDGVNTYAWDKTNRLLSMGGASYGYDGLGNRVRQTIGSTVTRYLLDLQPGLALVLAADGTGTTRYVHGPRGIQQQQNPDNAWLSFTHDGLDSVRGVFDDDLTPIETRVYRPDGGVMLGTAYAYAASAFGFTGEWTDTNALLYLRARYLNPLLGIFAARDPYEGTTDRLMSLNGYSWVESNSINRIDPSGMCWLNSSSSPSQQEQCSETWHQYTNIVSDVYSQNWPRDVQILVSKDALYWGNLPYSEFVSQWNSSRPPASTNPGGNVLEAGSAAAVGASIVGSPLGPADILIALGITACAVGLSVLANTGAISLPLRQPFTFANSADQSKAEDIAWPISPTRDGTKVVLFRAINLDELSFVRSVGFTNYGFAPSGGGKYFALTLTGVTQFAGADINNYSIFTITKIRVSLPVIPFGYFFYDVGRQGAGWSIHFSDEALIVLYADLAVSNERIVIIGAR